MAYSSEYLTPMLRKNCRSSGVLTARFALAVFEFSISSAKHIPQHSESGITTHRFF
jgi:hypothetical protein